MEYPHAHPTALLGGPSRTRLLAFDPAVGRVFLCDKCEHIHLQIGDIHLRTGLEGYQALLVLLNRAAANFELWNECDRSDA